MNWWGCGDVKRVIFGTIDSGWQLYSVTACNDCPRLSQEKVDGRLGNEVLVSDSMDEKLLGDGTAAGNDVSQAKARQTIRVVKRRRQYGAPYTNNLFDDRSSQSFALW